MITINDFANMDPALSLGMDNIPNEYPFEEYISALEMAYGSKRIQ